MAEEAVWQVGTDFNALKDALLVQRSGVFDVATALVPTINADKFWWPDPPKAAGLPGAPWTHDPYMSGLSDVGLTATTEYLFTAPVDQSWLIHVACARHFRPSGAAGGGLRLFTRFAGVSALKCIVASSLDNQISGFASVRDLWIPPRGVFGIQFDYNGNAVDQQNVAAGVIILAYPAKSCPVR